MKIQKEVKHVDAYGTEIKSGDTVKVIAVLPENANYSFPGFFNSWQKDMSDMLYGTFVVDGLGLTGVKHPGIFVFPSFCLEVIDEEQLIEDKLQEELDKNFGGDQSKMLREYYKIHYQNLE